jgi:hypothetical protein
MRGPRSELSVHQPVWPGTRPPVARAVPRPCRYRVLRAGGGVPERGRGMLLGQLDIPTRVRERRVRLSARCQADVERELPGRARRRAQRSRSAACALGRPRVDARRTFAPELAPAARGAAGSERGPARTGARDELRVRLAENPTTGYRWELSQSGNGQLELLEDAFEGAGSTEPGPPALPATVGFVSSRARAGRFSSRLRCAEVGSLPPPRAGTGSSRSIFSEPRARQRSFGFGRAESLPRSHRCAETLRRNEPARTRKSGAKGTAGRH